jgi:hypothetical protein
MEIMSDPVCPEQLDPSPYVIEKDVELEIYVDESDGSKRLPCELQTPHSVVRTHKSDEPVS